jgi:hypothetical protein
VRAELYSPVEPSNQKSTELTKVLIGVFARGMLKTLRGGQGARYCEGGEYAEENQTPAMRAAFKGTWRNTNASESAFGLIKYVLSHFANLGLLGASAIACAKKNKIFSSNSSQFEAGDKTKKRPAVVGLYEGRPLQIRRVVGVHVRGTGKAMEKKESARHAALASAASVAKAELVVEVRAPLAFLLAPRRPLARPSLVFVAHRSPLVFLI